MFMLVMTAAASLRHEPVERRQVSQYRGHSYDTKLFTGAELITKVSCLRRSPLKVHFCLLSNF